MLLESLVAWEAELLDVAAAVSAPLVLAAATAGVAGASADDCAEAVTSLPSGDFESVTDICSIISAQTVKSG